MLPPRGIVPVAGKAEEEIIRAGIRRQDIRGTVTLKSAWSRGATIMRKGQPKLSLLPDMSDELVTASQQVAVADGGRQRQTLQLSETPQPIPTRAASPVRYDSVKC